LDEKAIRLDGGDQTRDPLYVDDAVDAFIHAAHAGAKLAGRVINIGGGEEQTVEQLARRIVQWMNSSVPVVSAPCRRRPTEISRSFCDNAEAAQLLGWQPRTDLETGVRRTIDFITASRQSAPEPILSGEAR
jgi:UDP-glucose 4-epimerase